MRHHNNKRKFGLKAPLRRALMKSLATALVTKERITTTEAKAKELRPYVEKLVTTGKAGDLAARRLITSRVSASVSKKIVDVLAPKYKTRAGGYTRIMKLPTRVSDGSKMAMIEFV